MKRVVFLGGKEIGLRCLEELFKQQESLNYRLVAVGSSPRGENIREFCRFHTIPQIESLEELFGLDFEILLSVQYHAILKQEHIDCAQEIAFNLHLAPLPQYRGCNQFSFAILNEEREFGVTLHRLESGIDSGAVAFSKTFVIPEGCFVDELVELANVRGFELFCANLENLITGNYTLIPQDSIKSERREFHLRKEIESLKQIRLTELCGGGGIN